MALTKAFIESLSLDYLSYRAHFIAASFFHLSFGRSSERRIGTSNKRLDFCLYLHEKNFLLFLCLHCFFVFFLPPFAGDCKSGLRLSESHLIISSFLVFSVGLDLGLVHHLMVTCNSSSGELNVGAWIALLLLMEPVFFSPFTNIIRDFFCMVGGILAIA